MSNLKYLGLTINITQVKHETENYVRPKTLLIFPLYLDRCFCNPRFYKKNLLDLVE